MIETKKLTKKFGKNIALNNLDFNVEKGEIFCFLGANGAGKTTTINLLLGFLEPTSGEALINGLNVQNNIEASRSSLAYIPEQVSLYPELTGYENLEFFVKLAGKSHTSDFLVSCLENAGLAGDFHNITTNTYSKGMRQKVGIAIAIAKQAKVLLLDEPFAALDVLTIKMLKELIVNLQMQSNLSVCICDHQARDLLTCVDVAIILSNCKIIAKGTPAELVKDSKAQSAYFGDSFRLS